MAPGAPPGPCSITGSSNSRHRKGGSVECQFQLIPSPIGTTQNDSVYPYVLLAVDSQSYDETIASVPGLFLKLFDKVGMKPAALHISSETTFQLLDKTATALGILLELCDCLPALDEALYSLMEHIGGWVRGGDRELTSGFPHHPKE